MRLTMNPGVERACTATLPQQLANSKIDSATRASVCNPDTTSTSFITGTGLKKCMPTMRPGCCKPLARAVIEIEEVLDARTQSVSTTDSSCWKRALGCKVFDDGFHDEPCRCRSLQRVD